MPLSASLNVSVIRQVACTNPDRACPLANRPSSRRAQKVRESCLAMEKEFDASIAEACPQSRRSVQNLLDYLALRKHDLRDLQSRLAALGLSSLGRSESSTLAGVEAVIAVLESLTREKSFCPVAPHCLRRDFQNRSRHAGEECRRSAGTCPERPRRPCHGNHAVRSRPVLRTGEKPGRRGHGRHARELRPRFRARVGSNDRPHAPRQ